MEGYIIYILLAYIIFRDLVNDSRMNRMLNRIMAKNYEEYEYYHKKYDTDLKEVTKLRDEAREERIEEINNAVAEVEDKNSERIIDAFDEDWEPSEIDKTKVSELIE